MGSQVRQTLKWVLPRKRSSEVIREKAELPRCSQVLDKEPDGHGEPQLRFSKDGQGISITTRRRIYIFKMLKRTSPYISSSDKTQVHKSEHSNGESARAVRP